jgi:hypothetical protein
VTQRVSAFVVQGDNRMVFLQSVVEEKSNEFVHPLRRRPEPHPQRPPGAERLEGMPHRVNLLDRDTSPKVGITAKRLEARWDHDYRLRHISR